MGHSPGAAVIPIITRGGKGGSLPRPRRPVASHGVCPTQPRQLGVYVARISVLWGISCVVRPCTLCLAVQEAPWTCSQDVRCRVFYDVYTNNIGEPTHRLKGILAHLIV